MEYCGEILIKGLVIKMTSDEQTTIDNQRYYAEIIRFLRRNEDENSEPYFAEKQWVKIHASNYFVRRNFNVYKILATVDSLFFHKSINQLQGEELFYGKRKPRKVILDEERKTEILNQLHIDKHKGTAFLTFLSQFIITAAYRTFFTLGFHHGVKKMHRLLIQEYFWRYSYKNVSDFVQRCAVCQSNNEQCVVKTTESRNPWTDVNLFIVRPPEPSSEDQVLAILHDPASFWLSATALRSSSLVIEMALFLFENICNHGRVSFSTNGLTPEEFAGLEKE